MGDNTHSDPRRSRVDAMLDSVESALADDLVPVGIFNDEDIFRAEIERIFTKFRIEATTCCVGSGSILSSSRVTKRAA